MSIYVQAWVYKHSEAKLADRLVLLAIADEADDDGTNAFPSQRRIAEKARLARTTVQRSIQSLERLGELIVERPAVVGRGHFSRYVVKMGREAPGENPGDEVVDDQKGPQDESFSAREKARKGPPMGGPDPLTHRSIYEKAPNPGPSLTSLGRGLDASPLWEIDEHGNAVPVKTNGADI